MVKVESATLHSAAGKAVHSLINTNAHTSTVYVSPGLTVRATRRLYAGKIPSSKRLTRYDISLTIGAPNYKARKMIKTLKAADVPFPVRNPILTYPPVAKAKRAKARR